MQGARAKAASVAELAKTVFDLKGGHNPVASLSLGQIAEESFEREGHLGYAEATKIKSRRFIFMHCESLLPKVIDEIESVEVLAILRRLESAGKVSTAHCVRAKLSEICKFTMATMRAKSDPTYALTKAVRPERMVSRPAIINEREFGRLICRIDEYNRGQGVIKEALQVLYLCYPRPGELRKMKWSQIDFEERSWTIPAENTKMRRDHMVPLTDRIIGILKSVREKDFPSEYVFYQASSKTGYISENGFNVVLRKIGIPKDKHCAHGFRSSASTILNTRGYDERIIEYSLAHAVGNSVSRVYNRYKF